ncbi:MAG: hypothetical protein NDJ89_00080 [Oligoflexia bacterium]|nr:hypothetical protein [Oligoflexia bacterium]
MKIASLLVPFALLCLAPSCEMRDLRRAFGEHFEFASPDGVPVRGPEAQVRGRALGTAEESIFVTVAGEFNSDHPMELRLEENTLFILDGRSVSRDEFQARLRAGDPLEAHGNIQSSERLMTRSLELKNDATGFREGIEIRDPR